MPIVALEFPPISHLFDWPEFLFSGSELLGFNKIALINLVAVVLTLALFLAAGKRRALVPTGVQNAVEASVDFVRNGIVMQAMGPDGLKWMPFLTALFFFIFFNNIFEVVPGIQMPATGRMSLPALMAIMVWIIFIVVGFASQGIGYLKSALFPPGVPKALYVLVTPIEFISTFLVRPFSLAVRLYANMAAGHILVATFAILTASLWVGDWYAVFLPFPFFMLVFVFAFETLVAFLQAYIFTILTAVYIGGAMHPEH